MEIASADFSILCEETDLYIHEERIDEDDDT